LRIFGKHRPIETLAAEMRADEGNGSTLADVVAALRDNGIPARAVKLRIERMGHFKEPFVPFLPSKKDQQLGHFVVCCPTGSGMAVVLDGARPPYLLEMADLVENPSARANWDGTAILFGGNQNVLFSLWLSGVVALGLVIIGWGLWYGVKWRQRTQASGDLR
jgi:ABC-type bacteriocin/lantibiotic exporter with double-glycine peptidase domain